MDQINKPFVFSTENITRLIVLIVGLLASVFGLPDELAGQLQSSLIETAVSIAGLATVAAVAWSFINEGGQLRIAAFMPGLTDAAGYKTPEFWISVISSGVGLLALFGVVSQEQSDTLAGLGGTLVEVIFAIITVVVPQLTYARSRKTVKTYVTEFAG